MENVAFDICIPHVKLITTGIIYCHPDYSKDLYIFCRKCTKIKKM